MRGNAQRSNKTAQPSTEDTEKNEVPEAAGTAWLDGEEAADSPAREVMRVRTFTDAELADIDSWDVAMAKATAAYGAIPSAATELGTGFRIATDRDKERLQGVPLLLLEWSFNPGDFGEDFVSVAAIQRQDDGGITKWIINDGGTGIREQLREYTNKTGKTGGLGVPKGLRPSTYYIDSETKQPLTKAEVRVALIDGRQLTSATTFYLDTSA
jgi:hypothetical protein